MKPFIVLLLFLSAIFFGCTQTLPQKINGVSFVASPDSLKLENIAPLQRVNANYTAVMPFGFIRSLDHPEIIHDTERQWFGETSKGAKQYIRLLHQQGIKVMVKPQIWIWRGEFTGDLKMNSEEEWKALELSYRNFILTYVDLAEQQKVDAFCIGTELEEFVMNRPQFWKQLIQEIRAIYHGKLTYAANWDEYKRVVFWGELDFIGVDAYFPISESKTPSIEESKLGWKPWKEELKRVSSSFNKPILFTEYGYRSMDFAGKEPWDSNYQLPSINMEAQSNLLEGLYQELWQEPWFAGGFIWKWFIANEKAGGNTDNQFTPQNKPAEQVVKDTYAVKW
ncbi:MAG: glycoside hydrolase TIM-barrel-like domain-containing protein [Flavobacteriaceae bacterium]|nr:glycoside hydrolase TIM-barrel-like domain-containing protein [Flavobacteriaceae bacterium]